MHLAKDRSWEKEKMVGARRFEHPTSSSQKYTSVKKHSILMILSYHFIVTPIDWLFRTDLYFRNPPKIRPLKMSDYSCA